MKPTLPGFIVETANDYLASLINSKLLGAPLPTQQEQRASFTNCISVLDNPPTSP
ncbi:hypothetical protein BDW71DRAFT_180678 [Aspergillus fruticulosus]